MPALDNRMRSGHLPVRAAPVLVGRDSDGSRIGGASRSIARK
jgi:hypothetical protein